MKKLLFPLCLIISLQLAAQDDDGYVMYQTIQLKAHSGHQQQLREGLKAHNEKFHTGGSEAVGVWAIRSGPNAAGGISWVKGPLTWTSFDTPLTEDHRDDWQKNVDAHAEVGEFGYWRRVDGMSYAPEGFQAKVMRIRWFELKTDKVDDAEEIFGRIFEVYRKEKLDIGLHVFANQADYDGGRSWGILWQHDSWASMDKDRDWVAKYEALHGDGSWSEFFRDWGDAAEFKGTQLTSLIPELSTPDSE
jgi:hypothetical protein